MTTFPKVRYQTLRPSAIPAPPPVLTRQPTYPFVVPATLPTPPPLNHNESVLSGAQPEAPSPHHRQSLRIFIGPESERPTKTEEPPLHRGWTRSGSLLWGESRVEPQEQRSEEDVSEEEEVEEGEGRHTWPNQQREEDGDDDDDHWGPPLNLPHLSEEPEDVSISDHSLPPRPNVLLELPSDISGRSGETFVTARTSISTPASTPQGDYLSVPLHSSPTPAQSIVHQIRQSQPQSQSAQLPPPFPHRARRHGTRARSRSRSKSYAGTTQAPLFVQDDRTVIKRDLMLCKREVRDVQGRLTAYDDDEEKKMKRKSIGWREFEIVCRGGVVEFWRVSAIGLSIKRLSYNLPLHHPHAPPNLQLSLASSLDHTLGLTFTPPSSHHIRSMTIILCARSPSIASAWYSLLHRLLLPLGPQAARPIPDRCEVVVPDLEGLRVRVPVPQAEIVRRGERNVEAKEMVKVVTKVLNGTEEWERMMKGWEERGIEIGLCWRRFDRLEWMKAEDEIIGPFNVEKTHELELRPIQHTPDYINSPEGTIVEEPSPIEGYLTRLSISPHHHRHLLSHHRHKLPGTRLYVSSHDHLLFYVNAPHALLPWSGVRPMSEVTALVEEDGEEGRPHCSPKETGNRRSIRQMIGAHGVIDLCEVEEVHVIGGRGGEEEETESERDWIGRGEQNRAGTGEGKWFEIVMKNGARIEFEASTSLASNEWATRLRDLCDYWRQRREADLQAHIMVQRRNQALLRVQGTKVNISDNDEDKGEDDEVEALRDIMSLTTELDDEFTEGDNMRTIADPRIWSWCSLGGCKAILKTGFLYVKPPTASTFQLAFHVLTASGHLLAYHPQHRRQPSGQAIATPTHDHFSTLDLYACYLYSGHFCEDDLTVGQMLGSSHVPRVFGDGLISNDSNEQCTFAAWQPKLRRYFSGEKGRIVVVRRGRMLGGHGRVWVFRARSRQECEEWIGAVSVGMERWVAEEDREVA